MLAAILAVKTTTTAAAVDEVAIAVLAVAHAPQTRASRANTRDTSKATVNSRECCATSNHARSAVTSRETNNHAFRARNSSAKTPAARALM